MTVTDSAEANPPADSTPVRDTQLTGNGLFSGSLAFFVRGGIDKQKVILYVLLVQR